ncbi:MAG: ABC transporter permease [Firmicutes bacterium]|nr:ABC transporter permease [Bacillota bacterium]
MAIKSIMGSKLRSFLTMLGVIIGVGAVIAAVALAQGTTKGITDTVQSLGTNLIQITITGRNSSRDITYVDLKEFADQNSDYILALSPQVSGSFTVKVGRTSRTVSVIGTSPEYEIVRNRHVQSGRFILQYDVDFRQKVAVIGTAVAKTLFKDLDPIGESIKIDGQLFKIVGILEEIDGGQEQSNDDQIIIPVTTAQRFMRNATIRNFALEVTKPEYVEGVMEMINSLLSQYYRDNTFYRVFNQAQMLSTLGTVTGMMMIVLGGIATISLVVGGIGIMNIMLVSVTERTREIGIRKAVGAKKRNILVQFLIEALMVTGIGGILGVILGICVIRFILGGFNIVPEVYSIPWIIFSFGISIIVGIIFGIFPAYKAANLNPIEALRYE